MSQEDFVCGCGHNIIESCDKGCFYCQGCGQRYVFDEEENLEKVGL